MKTIDMQNKNIIFIIGIPLLIVTGLFVLFNKDKPSVQDEKNEFATTTESKPEADTQMIPTAVLNTPQSENPGDQGDVLRQAAYLIRAYDDHGKDYIGVDYVMVLQGEEAVKAQVEDKVCVEGAPCPVPPKGYVRNLNPHYRSYEISTTTPLTIEANDALLTAATSKGLAPASLTFDSLVEMVPTMPVYASSSHPFKEAKAFVYLDVVGGGITKISEPSRQ